MTVLNYCLRDRPGGDGESIESRDRRDEEMRRYDHELLGLSFPRLLNKRTKNRSFTSEDGKSEP